MKDIVYESKLNLAIDTCHSVDDILGLCGEQGNKGRCP